jgi:tRNA threonylcarbamoyladenosine biosynthesis protein TsaE
MTQTVMKTVFSCQKPDELGLIADEILKNKEISPVISVSGEMGAGKTTLIKAFCESLGVQELVNSPSFGIVNQYQTRNGKIVYHFDFYRLNSPVEALDLGYEEYLSSGNYCFIEWPEMVEGLLPYRTTRLHIREKEGKRLITIEMTP